MIGEVDGASEVDVGLSGHGALRVLSVLHDWAIAAVAEVRVVRAVNDVTGGADGHRYRNEERGMERERRGEERRGREKVIEV